MTIKEVVIDDAKADLVRQIIRMEHSLLSQGIPEQEVHRVLVSHFSETQEPIQEWPPKILGIDQIAEVNPYQIFDSGYPPILPDPMDSKKDELYHNDPKKYEPYLSECSIKALTQVNEVSISSDLTNVDITTPQGSRQNMENYLATGSKLNSQPSMHNEEGWVGSKAIPEERFRVSAPKPDSSSLQYIRETVSGLRQEFEWASDDYLLNLKTRVNSLGGKLYLIRAAEETVTDHRAEGDPLRRKLASRELFAMARTAINKDIDINHLGRDYVTGGVVVDAEFSDMSNKLQMIFWEKDPEIINAIDTGLIDAVSINAGKPRTRNVEQCSIDGEMCDTPTGLILGELDNIAITYVVTSPGFMWRGQIIDVAKPGVSTTAIEEF